MDGEVKQVSLLPGFVHSKLSGNGERYLHHITAFLNLLHSHMAFSTRSTCQLKIMVMVMFRFY
jgi:hypothetical protein